MKKTTCQNCGHQFNSSKKTASYSGIALGATLGKAHPATMLIGAGVGYILGSVIDDYLENEVDTHCPKCGILIRSIIQSSI